MSLPSVSCILPCGYGDKYVGMAIQCFLDQSYQGRLDLVIVDNNESEVEFGVTAPADLDQQRVSVQYHRCSRISVGALRNVGTSVASGEICISWDEDDWSHPDRVAQQVSRLQQSGKSVTGWHNILYWDVEKEQGHKYIYSAGRNHPPYAMGTSQCYLKSFWEKHKFPEDQKVEDHGFQLEALHRKQLDSCDAEQLCVARAHRDSKCPPQLGHRQFPAVERSAFPQQFFADMARSSTDNPAMPEHKE